MKNTLNYKGYIGSVDYTNEDGVFFGKLQGMQSCILYEGRNRTELLKYFREAVDDYLETCKEMGWVPETTRSVPPGRTRPAGRTVRNARP